MNDNAGWFVCSKCRVLVQCQKLKFSPSLFEKGWLSTRWESGSGKRGCVWPMSRGVAGWGKEGHQTGLSKWGCFQAKPIRRCFPPWSSNNQSRMCEQATWPISQLCGDMFTVKLRLRKCKLKTKRSLLYFFALLFSAQNFSQPPQRSYFAKSESVSQSNPYFNCSEDPSEKLS